ncbi:MULTISPECIES: hypothetical protein [Henriciella]|jgi:hypothetical protein|uniref:hypothetical protein n=1 Tax=Henriciella TaxID=453849 RepID=UPI00351428B4
MRTILTLGALAAALALPALAQDHTLDLTEDPSPNDEVIFSLEVPYELSDVDEMVTTFSYQCSIDIGLPRNGTATYNFVNFIENAGTDITGTPLSADGYRDVSGSITVDIAVPLEHVQKISVPGALASYKCEPRMAIGGLQLGVRAVYGDHSEDLSAPAWSRGVGAARVSGDLVLPGSSSSTVATPTPVQVKDGVDVSAVTPPSKLPKSPLFPKKPD